MKGPVSAFLSLVVVTVLCYSRRPAYSGAYSTPFGTTQDGQKFQLYTLINGKYKVDITNVGGAVVRLFVPDATGYAADVTTGFDRGETYSMDPGNHGCIVGRYANRIKDHSFWLQGKFYQLEITAYNSTVHSGHSNFCTKIWNASTIVTPTSASLILTYVSPDGDGGFPGTLTVKANYTLSDGTLSLIMEATTDKVTHVNLVHHPYFNLNGLRPGVNLTETALGHYLQVNSDTFLLQKAVTGMPTGRFVSVVGTPYDFQEPKQVGAAIAENNGKGFDHNWIINEDISTTDGSRLPLAAILSDPLSGRTLHIFTNQPGLQVYTANSFNGKVGKRGLPYTQHSFVALEAQHYPDTPHHLDVFPSTVLWPGEVFKSETRYVFSASKKKKTAWSS